MVTDRTRPSEVSSHLAYDRLDTRCDIHVLNNDPLLPRLDTLQGVFSLGRGVDSPVREGPAHVHWTNDA